MKDSQQAKSTHFVPLLPIRHNPPQNPHAGAFAHKPVNQPHLHFPSPLLPSALEGVFSTPNNSLSLTLYLCLTLTWGSSEERERVLLLLLSWISLQVMEGMGQNFLSKNLREETPSCSHAMDLHNASIACM